jgi:hypothetical protein
VHRIALVDECGTLSPAALESAAMALQIQLDRDLTAYWALGPPCWWRAPTA